jgi:hypothetical protein
MLLELLAAAVAIALTAAILLGHLRGLSGAHTATQSAAASTTSGTAGAQGRGPTLPPRAPGELLEDLGFEVGLGRWQAGKGTHLARVTGGHSGSWAASLAAARWPTPSMGIRQVQRLQPGKQYAVTVWLRANQPGTLVRVDVGEETGGRQYAVDSAGAVLQGPGWQPLEVIHVTHQPGALLAIQVATIELPAGGQVLVDDLSVQVATASTRP